MSDQHGETPDPAEARTEGGEELQAASTFDLRRIIGGLFLLYGVVLTILGIFDSDAEIQKAAGININLWAGIGMIIFAGLMIAWGVLRPLGRELAEREAA